MVKVITGSGPMRYDTKDLLEILKILRSPEGCPWDREQNHKSIRNDTLEEAYEVLDAIDNDDTVSLCEELGDMLLQVVFHSRIAEENGRFNYGDVVDGICKKLILRHPHVFGEGKAETSGEVLDLWDAIKRQEKNQTSYTDTLESVPKAFPALLRAAKVQKRARKANVGFELPELDGTADKLLEQLSSDEKGTAYGDLLFYLAGLQYSLGLNAEEELAKATDRFISDFKNKENNL